MFFHEQIHLIHVPSNFTQQTIIHLTKLKIGSQKLLQIEYYLKDKSLMYSCFKAKVIGFTFMHALTNCNTFYQNIQANILSLLNISVLFSGNCSEDRSISMRIRTTRNEVEVQVFCFIQYGVTDVSDHSMTTVTASLNHQCQSLPPHVPPVAAYISI